MLGSRIFRVREKKKIKYQIKKLSKNPVLTWIGDAYTYFFFSIWKNIFPSFVHWKTLVAITT